MYSERRQKASSARPAVNTTSRLFKQVVSFPHISPLVQTRCVDNLWFVKNTEECCRIRLRNNRTHYTLCLQTENQVDRQLYEEASQRLYDATPDTDVAKRHGILKAKINGQT